MASLATCQEITYRAYATALGIPLESVAVKLEGSLDLRGFFAVKDGVRAGFDAVRGVVNLKSSAPAADLAKLKEVVDAHCPVLDILRAPVPVDLKLETRHATQETRPNELTGSFKAFDPKPCRKTVPMSAFERLLEPGCTESPVCRCGREMEVASIERLPEGADADVRVYHCRTCHRRNAVDPCGPPQPKAD